MGEAIPLWEMNDYLDTADGFYSSLLNKLEQYSSNLLSIPLTQDDESLKNAIMESIGNLNKKAVEFKEFAIKSRPLFEEGVWISKLKGRKFAKRKYAFYDVPLDDSELTALGFQPNQKMTQLMLLNYYAEVFRRLATQTESFMKTVVSLLKESNKKTKSDKFKMQCVLLNNELEQFNPVFKKLKNIKSFSSD